VLIEARTSCSYEKSSLSYGAAAPTTIDAGLQKLMLFFMVSTFDGRGGAASMAAARSNPAIILFHISNIN